MIFNNIDIYVFIFKLIYIIFSVIRYFYAIFVLDFPFLKKDILETSAQITKQCQFEQKSMHNYESDQYNWYQDGKIVLNTTLFTLTCTISQIQTT